MTRPLSRRLLGLAAATSVQALLLGTAGAQPVRIFEEAPPLELLRSIMIPESRPGLSRRIVINAPDAPSATQPISAMEPIASGPEIAAATTQAPRRQPRPERGPAVAAARVPAPVSDAPPVMSSMPAPARAAAPQAEAAASVGYRINFALNSDVVPQSAYDFVERVGELMREEPDIRLQIEGHTDATGSDDYNLDLSRRRAMAVATYLVERQGIEAERLLIVGFGKTRPLIENPYDGRNRRVQFTRAD
jgi:outer membrane protein OmpA-like peptidoglycan-associated protein